MFSNEPIHYRALSVSPRWGLAKTLWSWGVEVVETQLKQRKTRQNQSVIRLTLEKSLELQRRLWSLIDLVNVWEIPQ